MKAIMKTTLLKKWDFEQKDERNTKDEILSMLRSSREGFISGETIAEEMNVTRAAIWKAIDSLRNEGHIIRAVPKKGYILESMIDDLTEEGIRSHLREDTKVSRVIFMKEIDSSGDNRVAVMQVILVECFYFDKRVIINLACDDLNFSS